MTGWELNYQSPTFSLLPLARPGIPRPRHPHASAITRGSEHVIFIDILAERVVQRPSLFILELNAKG